LDFSLPQIFGGERVTWHRYLRSHSVLYTLPAASRFKGRSQVKVSKAEGSVAALRVDCGHSDIRTGDQTHTVQFGMELTSLVACDVASRFLICVTMRWSFLLLLLSLCVLSFACHATAAASFPTFPLSTSGRYIVDSSSPPRRVPFNCVNWAGHMETLMPEGLQYASVETLTNWIAQMGFNCVRLGYSVELAKHLERNSAVRQHCDVPATVCRLHR
jgi:hypothetical protein